MGIFGGPNFEKLSANRDFEGLLNILATSKKEMHKSRAIESIAALGTEGTECLVSLLLKPGDIGDAVIAAVRETIRRDSDTALRLLVEPLRIGAHQRAIGAVMELSHLGDKRAIPDLISYLDLVEGQFGGSPKKLDNNDRAATVLFKTALFTRTADALYRLGSDAGVVVLLRMLQVHSSDLTGLQCEGTLMELTGKDFELELNVSAWLNWWHARGRSIDENILTKRTFAQDVLRLAIGNGIRPAKILDEATIQYIYQFTDKRSQTVTVSMGEPFSGLTTIHVHTQVARLTGENTNQLVAFAIGKNAETRIGMFGIAETEGEQILEFGEKLIMETTTPDYFSQVLSTVAAYGDDMEEKLSGTDSY